MYKICYGLLILIWIGDILNFPQFEFLDTVYPINFFCWLLIWMFLPSPNND